VADQADQMVLTLTVGAVAPDRAELQPEDHDHHGHRHARCGKAHHQIMAHHRYGGGAKGHSQQHQDWRKVLPPSRDRRIQPCHGDGQICPLRIRHVPHSAQKTLTRP
jgi:hypothetical protein